MGIPSYFSYIIKNYPNIIRKLEDFEKFDHLLMDCNSIIYDVYNSIEKNHVNHPIDVSKIEELILYEVVEKIKSYIHYISPKYSVFIAFDGVAPFAKMDQQRKRRYKSEFMQSIENKHKLWNTTNITPGTLFMKKFSKHIYDTFRNKENEYGLKKINISCSDEYGEGEHKLFDYIRQNNLKNDNIALYGLDSDLIMLSIFHVEHTKNIVIFREAPEFKLFSKKKEPNEKLFMNIEKLYVAIKGEMINQNVKDYMFMCILLGNDFMPHLIALNIRTNGLHILMETYRNHIGKYKDRMFLNEKNEIQWKWVELFFNELAKREHEYILHEYSIREKMERDIWTNKEQTIENFMLNLPILYRQEEKYICPTEKGWETRYYRELLYVERSDEESIKKICKEYKLGIDWVVKYYSGIRKDEGWKYSKDYGPLIKDVVKEMSRSMEEEYGERMNEKMQLAYVLPKSQLRLLNNKKIEEKIKKEENYEMKYGYERYIWEGHPKLEEISIERLKEWTS